VSDPESSWRKDPGKVRTRGCGHASPPRRRCEQCDPARAIFTACSAACLAAHVRGEHAAEAATAARIQAGATQLNQVRRSWEDYETHRTRLHRLLQAAQRAEGLCVLGAGNCDDLDLPRLVRLFGEVHLVDLDGAALAQGLARVSEKDRASITLHGGVDLSGVVDRIDRWGDTFPAMAELEALPGEIANAVAARVGRRFDVVLSACLLSQLFLPLKETLLLGMNDWQRLFTAVERTHLATVAALTREGGTGVLAVDVASSHKLPELTAHAGPETWEGLAAPIGLAIAARKVTLTPDPQELLHLLAQPPLAALAERPRLTDPWVWTVTPQLHALVYALVFTRAG
jgi:hypothetical protein